ncbi:MAG: PSD1 domain-containing protein, partial [Planctomycetales bacterium]|nr:PSD1 domain-containing protein [Planctomycetales bacterium]
MFHFHLNNLALGSILVGLSAIVIAPTVAAADVDADQMEFFESKVRPLLADKCWKCHSNEKQSGHLRLDSLQHMINGGDSGPAIDPNDADGSLLIQAVRYESIEMPPDQKLSAREVGVLERWIRSGAKWPNQVAAAAQKRDSEDVTDEDRRWWAFQPIVRPEIPESIAENPIDLFVERRLAEKGLKLSPRASPQQLVRRIYFDLIGLPPPIESVNAFAAADDPDAFSRIVDDLLNRFEYGERWGRHWLDVVRFAQTNGYERDDEKPLAWRYRDYVIRSFNEDKPFDQFVREQLAGDEMQPITDDSLDATAFYRLGVWDDEPDDARQAEFDALDDMLSTTGTAFLGLSIGCARCHSHKFDPIPQEDYYRMLAFIRNVKPYEKADNETSSVFRDLPSGNGRTLAVSERGIESPVTNVLFRGDSGSPGPEVAPGFPRVLFPSLADSIAAIDQPDDTSQSTRRRSEFANWVTSEHNPLTARVIVNRMWHYHFGTGLVDTPSDFGKTGSRPSHPELLDYLASELIAGRWRLKPIHRLILSSKTWQQSSTGGDPLAEQVDPGNRLLWRQNTRRLEAESIRDAVLSLAGTLNTERGGRGFFPLMPPEVLAGQSRPGHGWDDSSPTERNRRSVYVFAKRGITDPLLEVFDVATTDQPVPDRTSTTVAPQALTLLNGRFVAEQSRAAADRLIAEYPVENSPENTA